MRGNHVTRRRTWRAAATILAAGTLMLAAGPSYAAPTAGTAAGAAAGTARGAAAAVPNATPGGGNYQIHSGVITVEDFCLDADATHLGNGDKVQLWQCGAPPAPNQQAWFWNPSTFTLQVDTAKGVFCLDADSTHLGNGDKVQLWQCSGSVNQRWSWDGWSIKNHANGYCLDADATHVGNGDKIQLWQCDPNHLGVIPSNQVWWPVL